MLLFEILDIYQKNLLNLLDWVDGVPGPRTKTLSEIPEAYDENNLSESISAELLRDLKEEQDKSKIDRHSSSRGGW